MKPRRVIVTLEIETSVRMVDLKHKGFWDFDAEVEVKQVQVNVVRGRGKASRRKTR